MWSADGRLGAQERVLFVLDFANVGLHLGLLGGDKLVEVAFVVDGRDGLAEAARLRGAIAGLVLEGVHNQAIAEEELLVKGSYKELVDIYTAC